MISAALVQKTAVGILLLLTAGAVLLFSWTVAWSVAAGGLLALLSFAMMAHDLQQLLARITASTEPVQRQGQAQQEKKGLLLRFWLRMAVIALLLFLLIRDGRVHIIGLVVGLSTVVLAVSCTAAASLGRFLLQGRR